MNYLWQNYDRRKKYYLNEQPVFGNEIRPAQNGAIAVNPFGRFSAIFKTWMDSEQNSFSGEEKRAVENCLIHFLAQLDFKRGIHCITIEEQLIEEDILQERFGQAICTAYKQLALQEQNDILHLLRRQLESQNKENFFHQAVWKIFPGARLYYYEFEDKFLLYLPCAKSADTESKIQLLQDLFLDIRCSLEVFWHKHFGIIGNDATMHMDKMILY